MKCFARCVSRHTPLCIKPLHTHNHLPTATHGTKYAQLKVIPADRCGLKAKFRVRVRARVKIRVSVRDSMLCHETNWPRYTAADYWFCKAQMM